MRNLRTNKEGGGGVLPGGSGSGRGGRATTTTTTQAAAGGNRAANRAGGPTDPSIRRQRGILILSTRGPLDGDRTGQGRDGEGIHRGLSGASTARRLRLRRVAAAGPAASARACLAGPHGAAPGRPACVGSPSRPARWYGLPGPRRAVVSFPSPCPSWLPVCAFCPVYSYAFRSPMVSWIA